MKKILWADDQIKVVKTFSNLLSPIDCEIVFTNNCENAYSKIINNYFDLLILDLLMPPLEWGGLWLLQKLKESKINMPVLILSGEGTQTETIKALRLGATDYITKDKVEKELYQIVREIFLRYDNASNLQLLLKKGESENLEFKSTLRYNINAKNNDKKIEHQALKTIAAFLNSNGGTLLIGINDSGQPIGLKLDNFKNNDKMNLHLINLIRTHIGNNFCTRIKTTFEILNNKEIFRIDVKKSQTPAFLKFENKEFFYIRTGPSTNSLPISESHEYIKMHF